MWHSYSSCWLLLSHLLFCYKSTNLFFMPLTSNLDRNGCIFCLLIENCVFLLSSKPDHFERSAHCSAPSCDLFTGIYLFSILLHLVTMAIIVSHWQHNITLFPIATAQQRAQLKLVSEKYNLLWRNKVSDQFLFG